MKMNLFRRFGYYVLIAALIGLTSLFPGPAKVAANPEVALAASDPVIAAAGDIACDPTNSSFNSGNGTSGSCRQKSTSDLLVNAGLAAVLALGDNQYYCGGYQAFLQSYDLSWGRVKSITRPAVGNHEYLTSGGTDCNTANAGATGYFNYFGSAAGNLGQGYYSYDIGTWHLIALNSNCGDAGGCSSSSPQGQWLAADLAAHTNFCTLAYWHIPLFSSGGRANANTQSIWQTLYNNNVDLILNGHDHIYERFAPQTPNGTLDNARGMREFIVGSGGANHTSLATIFANSEVRNVDTFGILKLTLHPTSYDWQFVPEAGKTFTDIGTENCHGSGAPLPTATRTNTSLPTAVGNSFTFTPMADAYIDQTNATINYGSITSVQTDNSPVKHFLLKFNVTGINNQQITSAKLRLYNVNVSNMGGAVYRVNDNTWQENTVTWNNAPVADTNLLGSLGAVALNTWYEINLTSLITSAGTYSLRISSTSADGADYSSKEGANPPQLVIATQSIPTSTATQTPTFTSTATSTNTATSTGTPTSSSTPTRTPTYTATNTSIATATRTSTSTFTATATNGPTSTVTPTTAATFTSTPTMIFTPTNTLAATPTGTATNTPTSTPASTPTATGTNTASPTSTATSTATASSGFPITQVRDNFNRANGTVGSSWSGFTTAFAIASNQLDVTSTGWNTSILWNSASFGADQEAYVTLTQIDTASSNEQSLILKSQSNNNTTAGMIYVMYDGVGHTVQVWTYHPAQNWVQYGANIPVTFVNGDQLGARARPDGTVEIYRNGTLLGTRSITAWPFYANGGYIGLWFVNAPGALLDNFGGGTR